MQKRRFEVSGTTPLGDIWSFSTDDHERAQEILKDMREEIGRAHV